MFRELEKTTLDQDARKRADEIKISLMFGQFPAPHQHLSARLIADLVVLENLLARRRNGGAR